jgi:hypothetical protein
MPTDRKLLRLRVSTGEDGEMGRGSQAEKAASGGGSAVNGRAKDTGGRRWSVFRECHDRFGVVTGKGRRIIRLEDRFGASEIGHKGSGLLVY